MMQYSIFFCKRQFNVVFTFYVKFLFYIKHKICLKPRKKYCNQCFGICITFYGLVYFSCQLLKKKKNFPKIEF